MKITYILKADDGKKLVDERGGKATEIYLNDESEISKIKEVNK